VIPYKSLPHSPPGQHSFKRLLPNFAKPSEIIRVRPLALVQAFASKPIASIPAGTLRLGWHSFECSPPNPGCLQGHQQAEHRISAACCLSRNSTLDKAINQVAHVPRLRQLIFDSYRSRVAYHFRLRKHYLVQAIAGRYQCW